MKFSKRIIPALLLSNEGLYKTERFKNKKYIGDPINAIRIFNQKEVDELFIISIDNHQNKKINFNYIEELASECFMPLCYGGGIKSLSDVDNLFNIGVEKIMIRSILHQNPTILQQISSKYGSQALVGCLDTTNNFFQKEIVSLKNSTIKIKYKKIEDVVKKLEEFGVGEILLHDTYREGTQSGLNLKLISMVSSISNVPVVALGGAASLKDINEGFHSGADAVAAGSMFVFHGPHKAVLISYINDFYDL